jgi:hypothetical protein
MDINIKANKELCCLTTKLDSLFPFVDLSPQDFKRNVSEENSFSKKRSRMILSPFQTKVLTRVFQKTAFPSSAVRNNLSKAPGIPSRNIQIWFQNQRQKIRQRETTVTNSPLDLKNKSHVNIGPLEVLARAAFNNEVGTITVLPSPKTSFPYLKNQCKHLRPW